VIPVFPLHYGFTYDAKLQGTYDTIEQLAGTISTVHTLTSVYTSTSLSTTTVTTTMPAKTSSPVTALDLGLVALVIAMGIALAVLKRNKKHRHP